MCRIKHKNDARKQCKTFPKQKYNRKHPTKSMAMKNHIAEYKNYHTEI